MFSLDLPKCHPWTWLLSFCSQGGLVTLIIKYHFYSPSEFPRHLAFTGVHSWLGGQDISLLCRSQILTRKTPLPSLGNTQSSAGLPSRICWGEALSVQWGGMGAQRPFKKYLKPLSTEYRIPLVLHSCTPYIKGKKFFSTSKGKGREGDILKSPRILELKGTLNEIMCSLSPATEVLSIESSLFDSPLTTNSTSQLISRSM